MKPSLAALVTSVLLAGTARQPEQWPPAWCRADGPRQLAVTTAVTPVKASFDAGEPLLVRVTIANGLRSEIFFITYSTEMTDWNGEVTNLAMVEIARPGGLRIPQSYRPVVTPPVTVAGVGRTRVAAGGTATISTDLRKWDIGGWDPGEYVIRFAISGLVIDDDTTATVRTPCARFSIRR